MFRTKFSNFPLILVKHISYIWNVIKQIMYDIGCMKMNVKFSLNFFIWHQCEKPKKPVKNVPIMISMCPTPHLIYLITPHTRVLLSMHMKWFFFRQIKLDHGLCYGYMLSMLVVNSQSAVDMSFYDCLICVMMVWYLMIVLMMPVNSTAYLDAITRRRSWTILIQWGAPWPQAGRQFYIHGTDVILSLIKSTTATLLRDGERFLSWLCVRRQKKQILFYFYSNSYPKIVKVMNANLTLWKENDFLLLVFSSSLLKQQSINLDACVSLD